MTKAKRRRRSNLTEQQALEAFKKFCKKVERLGETTDASLFRDNHPCLDTDKLNVQFLVNGDFGVAEDLFEAVRIFGGHKLPAKS